MSAYLLQALAMTPDTARVPCFESLFDPVDEKKRDGEESESGEVEERERGKREEREKRGRMREREREQRERRLRARGGGERESLCPSFHNYDEKKGVV